MTPQVLRGTPASPGAAIGPAWTRPDAVENGGGRPPEEEAERARRGLALAAEELAELARTLTRNGHAGDAEIVEANRMMAEDSTLVEAAVQEALNGAPAAEAIALAVEPHAQALAQLDDPSAGGAGRRPARHRPPGRRPEQRQAERAAARGGRDRRRPGARRGGGVERAARGDRARGERHHRACGHRRPLARDPARHRRRCRRARGRRGRRGRRRCRPRDGVARARRRDPHQAGASAPIAWPSRPPATAASGASRPVTADGRTIRLLANAGTAAEVTAALEAGAEGIGLLRSELSFLEASAWPSEDEHARALAPMLEPLGNRIATVRTLDFGGDKTPPFLTAEAAGGPLGPAWHPARSGRRRRRRAPAAGALPRLRRRRGARARADGDRRGRDRRGARDRRGRPRRRRAGGTRPAGRGDDRGARRGADGADDRRALRLPLDRHQRPHPVHARNRSPEPGHRRRRGRPPSRGRAPDRARRRGRAFGGDPERRLRRGGRRSRAAAAAGGTRRRRAERLARADRTDAALRSRRSPPSMPRPRWPMPSAATTSAEVAAAARRAISDCGLGEGLEEAGDGVERV